MGPHFRRAKHFAVMAGCLFSFLSLVAFMQPVTTWSNGSYANNSSSYSYSSHYSTHDWVAEAALEGLVAVDAGNWNWLIDRKSIFLVGTEAPDNSGVSMTLDGTSVSGFGDTTMHHIYYNSDGTISNNEDDAATRAKWCGDQADAAMDAQKRDLAAFYLGAMTHYIADMGVFAHVAENNVAPDYINFDLNHATFEDRVETRTNNHDDRQEFFRISSFTVTSKTPYNAAKDLGWDTYKDPATSYGSVWLHNNWFSNWAANYAARTGETPTNQAYYNRVEQNLNNAIAACAAAMNGALGIGSSGDTGIPAYPLLFFSVFALIAVLGLIGWKYRKKLL